jgi:hypothetical protein
MFLQSVFALQCLRSRHAEQLRAPPPPQSTSVSAPFCTPSLQLAGVQVPVPPQTFDTQSEPFRHFLPSAHGAHVVPPQSMSVSVPSFTPLVQLCETQLPMPSQTLPPAQAAPFVLYPGVQLLVVVSQLAVVQSLVGGQSEFWRQPTHFPLPSHTEPPLSWHIAPDMVLEAPQAPALHAFVWQAVVGSGQLVASMQATHLPLPSQTVPPLSEQVVPFIVSIAAVQHPLVQASIAHVVDVQSEFFVHGDWQAGPPPLPPLPLVLATLVVPILLLEDLPVPLIPPVPEPP